MYLSCDLSTFQQGNGIGLGNSMSSSNITVDVNNYGNYVSQQLNSAISNFRRNGVSVQSQLF